MQTYSEDEGQKKMNRQVRFDGFLIYDKKKKHDLKLSDEETQ